MKRGEEKKEDKKGQAEKPSKLLPIISGIGRYILGLIILFSPALLMLVKGVSLKIISLGIFTPPLTLFILPPIIIGLYFMITGKTRVRVDVTLLLLAIICLIGLAGFSSGA